jgi:hypothetical protein
LGLLKGKNFGKQLGETVLKSAGQTAAGSASSLTHRRHLPCPTSSCTTTPSPFSEKVRLVLGYKQLAWKSVIVPAIMPKPDVVALTGGYRKTPFLQSAPTLLRQRADLRCAGTPAAHPHAVPRVAQGPGPRAGPVGRHHAVLGGHGLQPAAQGGAAMFDGAPPEAPRPLVRTARPCPPA